MERDLSEIRLYISSKGGVVTDAIRAYNLLKSLTIPLTTHNLGQVHSAAMALFCAGSHRATSPISSFFVHEVLATETPSSLSLSEARNLVNRIESQTNNMAEIMTNATNLTFDEVRKMLADESILDPADAIRVGLVHKIESELCIGGGCIIGDE